MLLKNSEDLPNFSNDETLIVDLETTSFDDKVSAFEPFNGHRIAGAAIGTLDAKHQWYMPLRHHSGNDNENFNFTQGIKWLKDVMGSGRDIVNHNIKFDGRFFWQDGIMWNGLIIDTMVLARLVHNALPSYSLDNLGKLFLGAAKDPAVSAYAKSIKTKDWGRVPTHLMGPYAEQDVKLTAELFHELERQLPSYSDRVWDIEKRLTKWILRSEITGVNVDWLKLKKTYARCLQEMIDLHEQINEAAGEEMDPNQESEITRILMGKFGIIPKAYQKKTGKPQWNQMALTTLDHPIGPLIAKYNSVKHYSNTYCKGWIRRRAEDGMMHADFKQSGTKTGRWSCKDPNLQNVPPEAEVHLLAREGNVIVAFDYSQVEYRIFGHYTNSEAILGAYKENPYMDFHGHLAGMLGVDRQFAKQMNFSFIYGMGKKALIKNIAGLLALKGAEDENMREQMRAYLTGGGQQTKDRAKQLNTGETEQLALKIYADYHNKFPDIKKFQKKVEGAVKRRGWIKNYYGRRYVFGENAPRHKSTNYIIQGSAADLCKDRIAALHEELITKYPECLFMTTVHDSVIFELPEDQYVDFIVDATKVLEDTDFRVPMLVDAKVAHRYLSQGKEVPVRLEQVGEKEYRKSIIKCMQESKSVKMKEWGS